MELKNKIIVISGAGSGLGYTTARHLIEQGAKIIALDINITSDSLDKWAGKEVFYQECDVRVPEKVGRAIESGASHFGTIDGVIACAGIAPAIKMHSSRKGSHTYDEFSNTLAVNLGGTFNLFNNCLPILKNNQPSGPDQERGCMIATSSIAAYEGQVGQIAYAASKGGVSSMILPLSRELARSGIRVNAIAPGIFQTPMVASFPKEVQESLANEIPFPHRLGQPQEFAGLVEHIFSNSYINGTVIRLDGSVRMR